MIIDWIQRQTIQAKNGHITIRNGMKIPTWIAFRCLYCGEYFNQSGAEEHFGKSRIDYNKEKVLKGERHGRRQIS